MRSAGYLLLLALALAGAPVLGGTFRMQSVTTYKASNTETAEAIGVEGVAQYIGSVDTSDGSWNINTMLNDSWNNDIDSWEIPDFNGNGNGGSDFVENKVIECTRKKLLFRRGHGGKEPVRDSRGDLQGSRCCRCLTPRSGRNS